MVQAMTSGDPGDDNYASPRPASPEDTDVATLTPEAQIGSGGAGVSPTEAPLGQSGCCQPTPHQPALPLSIGAARSSPDKHQGTIDTMRPGTTTTLRGAAPPSSSTIRSSVSAAASISAGSASAATVIRARTLPLTWIGYSTVSATNNAVSASGNGP